MARSSDSDGLVIHQATRKKLDDVLQRLPQTVLITGPAGIGKTSIGAQISAQLLGRNLTDLANHPYYTVIDDSEASISIDAVRELQQLLARKLPGDAQRVIVIEAADRLGDEAQNALLKSLEEPPERTTWLLTAHNPRSLLPTVRSRLTELAVTRPDADEMEAFFVKKGYVVADIKRAHLLSGGLPGLMNALLSDDTEHPLVAVTGIARQIMQADRFQRVAMIDVLAKDKAQTMAVLEIMQTMAHISIGQGRQTDRWRHIMAVSYDAAESLRMNGQPKLVLTNLMLHL